MRDNRKRQVRIELNLTEDERELLSQRMTDAGIKNMQVYLRKVALTGYILRLDISEVRETLRLLASTTNNINQLAKRANETRSIYAQDMIQLREDVGNLQGQVSDVMKVFSKVRKFMEL